MGGSEISVAVLAGALAKNHDVEILHRRPTMTVESLSQFASVDLRNVKLTILEPPSRKLLARHLWSRYLSERRAEAALSRTYDLFIAFTHGVPPYCAAPHSALLVLFPFSDLRAASAQSGNNILANMLAPLISIWRQWKWRASLGSYQIRLANSDFTRRWTKKRWDLDCQVVFPPVDIEVQSGKKGSRILSVGRFAVSGPGKKQIEMLQLFGQLKTSGHEDWNYDCAGGCGTSGAELAFLEKAQQLGAKCGANVTANIGQTRLKMLYQQAKIFWHAAGMDVDENLHPELAEHFGMTTVEAMAAGCVPVVINKGGQPEIVEHGVSGFLWNTPAEWRQYTIRLMQDEVLFQKMSGAARERSRRFSREAYVNRFHSLLASCLDEHSRSLN